MNNSPTLEYIMPLQQGTIILTMEHIAIILVARIVQILWQDKRQSLFLQSWAIKTRPYTKEHLKLATKLQNSFHISPQPYKKLMLFVISGGY